VRGKCFHARIECVNVRINVTDDEDAHCGRGIRIVQPR
jgi:hypothetical protein